MIDNGGKIPIPVQLESMRELLAAIEMGLPVNSFPYKRLNNKVRSDPRRRWNTRGRRGNRVLFKNRGRGNRTYCQAVQVERNTSEYGSEGEYNHIEVGSEASVELVQDMHREVGEEEKLRGPLFSQHTMQKKISIHVLVTIQGAKATVLIDCEANDNFINYPFMKKGDWYC